MNQLNSAPCANRSPLPVMMMAWMLGLALAVFITGSLTAHAGKATGMWQALRMPGHFAMLRHALAPGTGDPANFTLDDCSTQRNLSDVGRAQAVRIGRRLRQNGIERADLFTSQWCRCRETAAGLDLGPVRDLPALNSFYEQPDQRAPRMKALRQWLAARKLEKPTILVTHQVTISALTGVYPSSGELVVVRRDRSGEFTVVGTVETD